MTARDMESALLARCAAVAHGTALSAQNQREAHVFQVAAALVLSQFPRQSQCLLRASEQKTKWGQTPINLSALHNQIGVTGPKFGKDGAFRSITAVACNGPCMLQCYM